MKNKMNWLEAFLVLAPFVLLAVLWRRIPERIPVHWNADGQIDGWGSKSSGMLVVPLISFATVAVLHLIPWLDPKLRGKRNWTDRMSAVLPIFRVLFAAFFCVVFLIVFFASLGAALSVGRVMTGSILLLMAGVGNYLGNLRPNYFIGLRTPWTLESDATWRATHRLGGRLMFFGAIALLLAQFVVPERAFVFLFVAATLLLVIWSFVYSWRHYRAGAASSST